MTFGEFVIYLITEKGSLDIRTPDGSDEPLHPSVCYIDNDGWNGYNYWMAFTPYPIKSKIYRDRFECPCVVVSNDGLKWKYLNGKEYIDDLTNNQIAEMDYFSDPELVFVNNINTLHCYYRLSVGGNGLQDKTVTVYRKSTRDGVNWTERQIITFCFDIVKDSNEPVISPAIVFDGTKYYLWFVSDKKVFRMSSDDGVCWYSDVECLLHGEKIIPWHISIILINNEYILTIYDMTERITIWKSEDGTNFTFCVTSLLHSKRMYSYYRATLYRASVVFDGNYKLYFSAGNTRRNSIGLMSDSSIKNLKVKYIPFGIYRIRDFKEGWLEKYLIPYKMIYMKVRKLLCRK